jgi:hypothetical protein
MSCQALKSNLTNCRNWSCLDSDFCWQHEHLPKDTRKSRWIRRYFYGENGLTRYSYWTPSIGKKLLKDLESKRIVLTKGDIASIPSRDRNLDIYLFLIQYGYAQPSDNCELLARSLWYYIEKSSITPHPPLTFPLKAEIRDTLILDSGRSLFRFLKSLAKLCKSRMRFVTFAAEEIPRFLDSAAAKELSWWTHQELDELRVHYEKELGAEHPLTRCLVQRWLLDLKELYQTEKAIQKIKMDQCKEEIMMNRWHPDRIMKMYEEYGIEIDDL